MSNLKGIWIPIEILTDNKLSDKEKSIYSETGTYLGRRASGSYFKGTLYR